MCPVRKSVVRPYIIGIVLEIIKGHNLIIMKHTVHITQILQSIIY